jgi:enamine deaminase RidA (YjgF/YER057c/UK114 family)
MGPMRTHTREASLMIKRESCRGIGYSIAELNGVRHVFVSAVPRQGNGLPEQVRDALRTVRAVIGEHSDCNSIVHQAVFVRDLEHVETCRQIILDFYGDQLPATSYIPQAPCDGKELAIEALGVGCGEVEIERCCEQLVVARHSGTTWIHAANLFPSPTVSGVYDRSLVAFEKMSQMLAKKNVRYDEVIRTWLYLGDIVGMEGENQRYKELNRARTDFYTHFTFGRGRTPAAYRGPVYPASTGIGTEGKGITMSCIALQTERPDVILVPLENPQQVSAFDYGEHYSPKSPKFARAMAVAAGDSATVFVSGTASITDAESRFIGDVAGQTNQTLDNIAALISAENFSNHGAPGLGATLDNLALVRVYIKRQEDFEKTRAVCEARFGERPTIYAVADVCRPELLVEIEGVAYCQQTHRWPRGPNGHFA